MKYIFLFFCILILSEYSFGETFELAGFNSGENCLSEDYIKELNYAEKQIFHNVKKDENTLSKLERLELSLFGAIQSGNLIKRIANVYKSCQNFYEGNYGPYYVTGNGGYYTNNFPNYNYYSHYNHYHKKHHYPVGNGYYQYYQNVQRPIVPSAYQLGTTVRILND